MSHSVRLTLRAGLHLNLDIQEVPEMPGCGNVEPQSGDDSRIVLDLTVEPWRVARDAERKSDGSDAAASTAEQVGKHDGGYVWVGDQGRVFMNPNFLDALNHQTSPIGTVIDCSELNRRAAGQIMPTRKPGVES